MPECFAAGLCLVNVAVAAWSLPESLTRVDRRGALFRHPLSRGSLLQDVWGYSAMPSTRTVDVHVAWLRQKLEPNPRVPQHILTVHGLGYKFAG